MKKFISGVLLFLIPILLTYFVFGFVVYQSGEWRTEEEIAQRVIDGEPAFLGLAYRDNRRYYKHLVAEGKAADLLVLGTSRSMQFSSDFFTQPSFYNAGGGANTIYEYRFFLQNLAPDALPKTVILVLDQYFFQEGWGAQFTPVGMDYSHYDFKVGDSLRRVLHDYADGKFRLRDALVAQPNRYGIAAMGRGSGFYADGSYCYGSLMDHPENGTDVGFVDSFDRIQRGVNRFEWADRLYQPALEEVDALLSYCSDHNIQVVGIIPPYAPSVYARMQESGNYGYLDLLPEALTQRMQPYGYELFDFTNMPDTRDAEYIDGYHGGDRVYARLTRQLADQSRILAGQIDTEYLDKALSQEENPLRLTA